MIARLEQLGLPREKRTEIRQILSAYRLSMPACW